MQCLVCDDTPVRFRWTDTHGVAQCGRCGTPYRIYHYENGKRADRPERVSVFDWAVPALREYWSTFHRPIPSGHSFGCGNQYELASRGDTEDFHDWFSANRSRFEPAPIADKDEVG